jgi:ketosteroid isomerase-like protein
METFSPIRIIHLLAALVFCGAFCIPAHAALSPEDRAALQKAHAAATKPVEQSPSKVDWPAYVDAHYDAKAKLLPAGFPIVEGRDAIISFFNGLPSLTVFKIEAVDMEGEESIAYIRGTYTISLSPPDGTTVNDQGKYVQVWRKRADGEWRCILDIYNSDLPPA